MNAATIIAIGGPLIPLLTAVFTRLHASGWLKTTMAIGLGAGTSFVASIGAVNGHLTWQQLVQQAVLALAIAGGSRFSWLSGLEHKLARATDGFGLGGAPVQNPHDLDVTPPVQLEHQAAEPAADLAHDPAAVLPGSSMAAG